MKNLWRLLCLAIFVTGPVSFSQTPQGNDVELRSVTHFRDGSEIGMEAKKVEFKDVPENLNDDLKALPIKGKNN
ncbi:MAG TPA: hypothetical protein VNI02_02130 [Blastocatellia bacterium]|nr:hypothetical protein [Blastocatellia bacterium]